MGQKRRGLSVKIDAEVLEQLRHHVITRHGALRGFVGEEVENAIKMYLAKQPKGGKP